MLIFHLFSIIIYCYGGVAEWLKAHDSKSCIPLVGNRGFKSHPLRAKNMRAFVAFEIPEEIKVKVAKTLQDKKTHIKGVKWVEPENLHITCKFLGEVSDELINELVSELESNLQKGERVRVKISGAGAFPDSRKPRVLWLGVEGETEKLQKIWEVVENSASKLKIGEPERNYIPHLTIGRVKIPITIDKNLFNLTTDEFVITYLTLFQSTLTPSGPIYKKIRDIKL